MRQNLMAAGFSVQHCPALQAWKLDTFEVFAAYLRILSFRGTTRTATFNATPKPCKNAGNL